MESTTVSVDFRKYRPAAIIVIDLVKHSTKERAVAVQARTVLEHVIASHVKALALDDVAFNFTGDGYVCAFLGDASCRVIDFLNCAIPQLRDELRLFEQPFRCGVDFGLIHLADNILTRNAEHFEAPGILAARLEQAAGQNEILVTEVVKTVFEPLYPQVFNSEPRLVTTKDRVLRAFTLTPLDYDSIRLLFRATLFTAQRSVSIDSNCPILIADDDLVTTVHLEGVITDRYPDADIVVVGDGSEALLAAGAKRFVAAILDINMPGINGLKLAEILLRDRPDMIVIIITGMAGSDVEFGAHAIGVSLFLRKPVRPRELCLALERCLSGQSPARLRASLMVMSDKVGGLLTGMWRITKLYERMTQRRESDAATSLLRHKAKGVGDELIASIRPGADIARLLMTCEVQLESLNRLCDFVERSNVTNLVTYLINVAGDYATMYPQIRINVSSPSHEPIVVDDVTLLTLSLCELIDNAVVALNKHGVIDVTISPLTAVGLLQTRVHDSGPGVPSSIRANLFLAGTSTHGPGRGLGLSLVRDAVKHLGGSIDYEFESGATFTIKVPLTITEVAKLTARPTTGQN